ncbi:MAG: ribonuclease III [Hyphomicrobiaceae bacterium]
MQDVSDFDRRLGYCFENRQLRDRALTHASVRSGRGGRADNERLEFIGDRVLALAVAEMLCEIFPAASEGDLARRFNLLVRGEACAAVAREIDLGAQLIMGGGEAESGGRGKDTILADAMEAVLGAIFLEGGFEKASAVVRKLWQAHVERLPQNSADAKSALQEWSQERGWSLPRYKVAARSGPDHAPIFSAEVHTGGKEPVRGEGPSKRTAEQAAARAFLTREGVWRGPPDDA